MNWIAGIIFAALFLTLGLTCLLRPKKVQRYYLDFYERNEKVPKLNPFLGWMHTSAYIISLRLIGVLSLLAFLLIAVTLIAESLKDAI